MILRNTIIPSILLFTLVSVGCSPKQEKTECDSTKFDCTPKTEIVASEPVPTADEAVSIALQVASDAVASADEITTNNEYIDGDPDFYVSPEMPWSEQKKIINSSFKSLIKDEINTILNSNIDTWVIDVKSVKDGTGDQKGFVIYKYDVTSSSPDHDFLISEQTCTAKAQISSEDNRTPMAMTIDTNCYKNLEGFF